MGRQAVGQAIPPKPENDLQHENSDGNDAEGQDDGRRTAEHEVGERDDEAGNPDAYSDANREAGATPAIAGHRCEGCGADEQEISGD